MNLKNICIAAIFLSLFIESVIFPFPLVFVFSILLYIFYPEILSIVIAFSAGLILDMLKLSQVGETAFVIVISLLLVDLFKKSFELKDYKFVLLFLFFTSYVFAKIFGYNQNLLIYIAVYSIAGFIVSHMIKKKILW